MVARAALPRIRWQRLIYSSKKSTSTITDLRANKSDYFELILPRDWFASSLLSETRPISVPFLFDYWTFRLNFKRWMRCRQWKFALKKKKKIGNFPSNFVRLWNFSKSFEFFRFSLKSLNVIFTFALVQIFLNKFYNFFLINS